MATVLKVSGHGRMLDCNFSRRGTSAREWQTIVDHFVIVTRIAAALLAKRASIPTGSRLAGRGSTCAMPLPVYLAARVMWEAHPVVAAALEDGTLIVHDEHVVPPFALEVARLHHRSLAKAIKNEFREAEEIDPPEAAEESPSAVEST